MARQPRTKSIILTTVTDVVGFLSFLGIATILIGWLYLHDPDVARPQPGLKWDHGD